MHKVYIAFSMAMIIQCTKFTVATTLFTFALFGQAVIGDIRPKRKFKKGFGMKTTQFGICC